MEGCHKSVLLKEAVEALQVEEDKWYLDCTLGLGGHTLEILKQGGKVIGIDVDPEAIKRARERLGGLGDTVLIQGNFRDIKDLILRQAQDYNKQTKNAKLAGAVFDLGVSSLQLETPERGFSFVRPGPIDMRMDPGLAVKALDLLNVLSRKELYELFTNLGEEKYSKRLADALVSTREVRPFNDTVELAEFVARKVGKAREKIHPATRVFQALRIAVNDELGALREGLEEVRDLVKGRIVVISFHSLEDRIVKNTFRDWQEKGLGEIITKKPVTPENIEVAVNSRSRSAKMRVFFYDHS